MIHTGKRYSDYIDRWKDYSLYSSVDELAVWENISQGSSQLDEKRLSDDIGRTSVSVKRKYPELYALLHQREQHRQSQLEQINSMIEEFKEKKGDVPSALIDIKTKLSSPITEPSDLSMNDYIEVLQGYIHSTGTYSKGLVRDVVEYCVVDFVPSSDSDFPYSSLVDPSSLYKLVQQTKYLKDDDPRKWTDERILEYRKAPSSYDKLVVRNDTLYTWKKYILPSFVVLTPALVRAAYLIYTLLFTHTEFFSSRVLVYKKLHWREYLRLRYVLHTVFGVCEKELHLNRLVFFTPEMLRFQGSVTKEFDKSQCITEVYDNQLEDSYVCRPEVFIDFLQEKGWFRSLKLIQG